MNDITVLAASIDEKLELGDFHRLSYENRFYSKMRPSLRSVQFRRIN